MLGTLKLTITKRWLQNEKDRSKFRKSWDHSHTSWNYQAPGKFITSSMQFSLCRIWKQTYTDPIMSDPPPDIENDEERYKVETILRHQKRGRGYRYYVKWKGYPITEALWESTTSFDGGGEKILNEYQRRHDL